jgi:hypothetical protein
MAVEVVDEISNEQTVAVLSRPASNQFCSNSRFAIHGVYFP